MTIGRLSGHGRPGRALLQRLGRLHNPGEQVRLTKLLDETEAVDAFSRLLTEAIEKNTTKDGRIDMRDVAAHVLAEMKRHQR